MTFKSIRYTFEECSDMQENRKWFLRFLKEHNTKNSHKIYGLTHGQLATRVITAGYSTWLRVRFDGALIAYARYITNPHAQGAKTISDVWVRPKYRRKGHFNALFPNLVYFTGAEGVCLTDDKIEKFSDFYARMNFTRVVMMDEKQKQFLLVTPSLLQRMCDSGLYTKN